MYMWVHNYLYHNTSLIKMQIKYEKALKKMQINEKTDADGQKLLYLTVRYDIITAASRSKCGERGRMMILPMTKQYTAREGCCCIPTRITYSCDTDEGVQGGQAFASFADGAVRTEQHAFVRFECDMTLEDRAEIYRVSVSAHHIRVGFRDARGAVCGAATVALLLRKETLPCCEILDYPSCAYRSFLLDMARGLPREEDIVATIRCMALAKYNRLHLHLTDSEGPCYRSDALPAYRYTGKGEPCDKALLQRIDALCADYAIEIVPEIEVPAHATAICRAYPAFRCEVEDAQGWAICPGNEEVWPFFDALIGEVAAMFPRSTYIHIGTDELEFPDLKPPVLCHWDSCPRCAALRRQKGLEDRQAEFYYVVERIYDIVRAHGRKMIMWNDQIDISREVPLSRDILIQFWRVAGRGRGPVQGCSMAGFLEQGFEVVNAYYPYTYCDLEDYLTPEKLRTWTPYLIPTQSPAHAAQVIGGETCAWEFGNYEEYPYFAYTVPPVLAMFGDKLWALGEREYNDEYRAALAEFLFGSAALATVFDVIGSLIPPRTRERLTYRDPAELSEEEISACITQLRTCGRGSAVAPFAALLERIRELIRSGQ